MIVLPRLYRFSFVKIIIFSLERILTRLRLGLVIIEIIK